MSEPYGCMCGNDFETCTCVCSVCGKGKHELGTSYHEGENIINLIADGETDDGDNILFCTKCHLEKEEEEEEDEN